MHRRLVHVVGVNSGRVRAEWAGRPSAGGMALRLRSLSLRCFRVPGGGGEECGTARADQLLVRGHEGTGVELVGSEALGVVPVREGAGEHVRVDECEAGALSGEERGRVRVDAHMPKDPRNVGRVV